MNTIAREYAKAVFDISIDQNNTDQWKIILRLLSEISQNSLIQLLCLKLLDSKILSEIIITICQDYRKDNLDQFVCNFIHIISKNSRVLLLPVILKEFNDLYDSYSQSIIIEVISARRLHNDQLKKIIEIMTYHLSKMVIIKCSIDTTILAGIVVRIKDTVIDGSLQYQLSRLNYVLKH